MTVAMNSALSTLPHPVSSTHVQSAAETILRTAKDGESDPTVLERMALLEHQIRPDSSLLPYRVKEFGLTIKLAGASGTFSDHSPCYRWSAADVQSFDVFGSRSKRSNCASDDEADARRQKRPARS